MLQTIRHIKALARHRRQTEAARDLYERQLGDLIDGLTIGQAKIALPDAYADVLYVMVSCLIDDAIVAAQGEETPDPKLRRLMDMV